MSRWTLRWTADAYERVGPGQSPECAVPGCINATTERGLCHACYRAWLRGGMKGLRRRADRVIRGERITVPMDVDQALLVLVDVYEDWEMAQEERDPALPALQARLLQVCKLVGTIPQRKRWSAYARAWHEKYRGQLPGATGRGQTPHKANHNQYTKPKRKRVAQRAIQEVLNARREQREQAQRKASQVSEPGDGGATP